MTPAIPLSPEAEVRLARYRGEHGPEIQAWSYVLILNWPRAGGGTPMTFEYTGVVFVYPGATRDTLLPGIIADYQAPGNCTAPPEVDVFTFERAA